MTTSNPERADRFRPGPVLAVSAAHFVHDVFTACIAPLLPLIIDKLGLTLVRAGSLVVYTQLPSLFNPLLGAFVDRRGLRRALLIVGPGATGTLICLMGLAPGYASLAVLLLTVGCSVALMHLTAPVIIAEASGRSVGRGMSVFMLGGELARSVGPLVAVQLVSSFGLEGLWRVVPVAVASSALLAWRLRDLEARRPSRPPSNLWRAWVEMRRTLAGVIGILMARAFMVGGLTTFLPTFVYGEGGSLWMANISLAVYEAAGAAGALISGTVSDWVGRRRVLFGAVALAPLLMLAFLHAEGWARLACLAGLGLMALATTPVLLAVTIENSGSNPAAASGTFMMISFAARSLIILAVGAMGDAMGLRAAYAWCAGFAALGLPFVFVLPASRKRAARAAEAP